MLKQIVHIALGAVALGSVLALGAAPAQATTVYQLDGTWDGGITPVVASPNGYANIDYFSAHTIGTLTYNEVSHQAQLAVTFSGLIFDNQPGNGVDPIGTLTGNFSYNFQNVNTVGNLGPNFIASTGTDPGTGAGQFNNLHITANGANDDASFFLQANGMTGNTIGSGFNPIASFFPNTLIYFLLGDLEAFHSFTPLTLHSWFGTHEPVNLELGAGRNGLVNFTGDYHAFASTSVPEPTSMALLGMGLLGGVARRRRQRAS